MFILLLLLHVENASRGSFSIISWLTKCSGTIGFEFLRYFECAAGFITRRGLCLVEESLLLSSPIE